MLTAPFTPFSVASTLSPKHHEQGVPEDCNDDDVKAALGDYWVSKIKWLTKDGWSGKGFIQLDSQENAEKVAGEVCPRLLLLFFFFVLLPSFFTPTLPTTTGIQGEG